jgi:hypothetical protein
VPPTLRDELDKLADALMDALLDLDVVEPAVSVVFSESTLELEMMVDAPSAPDALRTAQAFVHQAMTAIGMRLVDDTEDDEPDEWTIRRERMLTPA